MKKKEENENLINEDSLQLEKQAKWYIIQTYSGYDNSVKEDLLKLMNSSSKMSRLIFEVVYPQEKYFKIKADGTKKEKERKMFSGYVFVKMIVTDYSWFVVRNLPKVTGFLGSSSKGSNVRPVPLRDSEIKPILVKMGIVKKTDYNHLINKKIEITSGSFVGKQGVVTFVDNNQSILVVEIDLFGRNTPVQIPFTSYKEIK
ncbi:transcription termination/antitermination factor [Candidatus Phytoplasma luffae]|uniref:Transcription termination/antitermination protein NusG n=1 Tax=Loofah witches'-broom phytoplasma TaxID=35773 RepID=A0A975FI82_LOWBP|nr:transcription termination/antitermination protein NusG [Candidatus Phytoplasma luffae]QTX02853.1 transcription termination/antitermination factor [Candidatus Phytoplasma luffae]